jgi:RNA polymerase sigma-70 factor (ECF subfamily)
VTADTDEHLLEQVTVGRSEALDELYRRYARKLYVFCATAVSSRHPEDLVHDVFARVIETAHQFDPRKAPFRTWLYRIAYNRGIDVIRREKRVTMVSLEQEKDPPVDAGVETSAMKSDLVAGVRHCLQELKKEREREALTLYYLSGKVFREIGEIFDISTSMAQKLVRLAREKMKRCLERSGVEP